LHHNNRFSLSSDHTHSQRITANAALCASFFTMLLAKAKFASTQNSGDDE
jgi:hypothetical protein